MIVQAAIDIDVDLDFGLAKAIRIAHGCGLKRLYGDSIKRVIRVFVSGDVDDKIRCLSSIKGFFTVDLRLLIELCKTDRETLKTLGVAPTPRALPGRIIGYAQVGGRLYMLEKTSREGTVIVRLLRTRSPPTFVTPSLYLIQTPSSEVVGKVFEVLEALKAFGSTISGTLSSVCSQNRG